MNWIKENKFLTGFFAVLVVVGGALGYLLYSAMSHYGEVSDNYDRQSAELSRLRGQKPYPNEESLAKLKEEEKEHEAKVSELEKKLATMKITVPPIAPAQFQDKLKASVDEYVAKAKQAGMTLPEKFYLGFERYQSEPPSQEAAPLLSAELEAMRIVLDDLPKNGVTKLEPIVREPLPEEKGGAAPPPPGNGPRGLNAQKEAAVTHTFSIEFTGPKLSPQAVLNDMITNQQQFFIPREVRFTDTEDKGPPRTDTAAGAQPNPGIPPNPTTPPGPAGTAPITTIVGNGFVDVRMRIEIVDFPDPAGNKAPAPKAEAPQ